jgi:Ala-tRNA(Pro) deacylase
MTNERLEQYLRQEGARFERHSHPVAYTAQAVAEAEHVSGKEVAKVVMVKADGEMAMLVLPAHLHVNLTKVAEALGAKEVRLAREDEFEALFPDCETGAMPPFGNLYGIPTYVDAKLAEDEEIVFQSGTHTETVWMRYEEYARLAQSRVADISS